jgi:hypothetical protein
MVSQNWPRERSIKFHNIRWTRPIFLDCATSMANINLRHVHALEGNSSSVMIVKLIVAQLKCCR